MYRSYLRFGSVMMNFSVLVYEYVFGLLEAHKVRTWLLLEWSIFFLLLFPLYRSKAFPRRPPQHTSTYVSLTVTGSRGQPWLPGNLAQQISGFPEPTVTHSKEDGGWDSYQISQSTMFIQGRKSRKTEKNRRRLAGGDKKSKGKLS